MSKAKPDYDRYVYVYVPSLKFKERWEKLAKKSKVSLSKFIFEHVESFFDFYLSHMENINNWDLVDSSAPYILGDFLFGKDKLINMT